MRIDTVLFDMGGTLEDIFYSSDIGSRISERIAEILGIDPILLKCESGEDIFIHLQKQYGIYKDFRESHLIEIHPAMVWRDWVLKGFSIPDEVIFDHYEDLAYFWETEVIIRKCREEAKTALDELKKRNIKMGIISNTGSFTQVHKSLSSYGLTEYFDYIGLSSTYGIRKPHGFLFRDVLNRLERKAERALYVGDTISRDVIGARNAGFFGAIQIKSKFTQSSDSGVNASVLPDYVIHNLMRIPEILDELNES